MSLAVGSDYERLLADFLSKGGDLSGCPFETADYKWQEPPHREIASDSDWDPVVDEVWEEIRRTGLKGEPMTEEEWARWDEETRGFRRRD